MQLKEHRIDTISFPILFENQNNDIFTCKCFAGRYDAQHDILRFLINQDKRNYADIKEINGICHLCTLTTPHYIYGSPMYFSIFSRRFLPYHELYRIKKGLPLLNTQYRDIEMELRNHFGYPTSRALLSETIIFNLIKQILPEEYIIRHYRGRELKGLELDIYIPSLGLGVEFQGKQHYEAVDFFGGEEKLKEQKKRDKKKKMLCKISNIRLVYFREDDVNLCSDEVRAKLFKHCKN